MEGNHSSRVRDSCLVVKNIKLDELGLFCEKLTGFCKSIVWAGSDGQSMELMTERSCGSVVVWLCGCVA